MDKGKIPWWANSELKIAFWRPLTSLTHYIEYRFLENHVWLMHLHSILIYGLVAGMAALLYRRFSGTIAAAAPGGHPLFDRRCTWNPGWLARKPQYTTCSTLRFHYTLGSRSVATRWMEKRFLYCNELSVTQPVSAEAGIANNCLSFCTCSIHRSRKNYKSVYQPGSLRNTGHHLEANLKSFVMELMELIFILTHYQRQRLSFRNYLSDIQI